MKQVIICNHRSSRSKIIIDQSNNVQSLSTQQQIEPIMQNYICHKFHRCQYIVQRFDYKMTIDYNSSCKHINQATLSLSLSLNLL